MSTQPSTQPDPIADGRRRYFEAIKAADVAAVVSLFCENAIYMPPNDTSLYGGAEIKEWHEDYFKYFQIVELTETEREVTVLGDWAIERSAYTVAIQPVKGGDRIRDDGRFVMVWKREPGGAWKIAQAIHNSIRPVGSGTSRFLVRMSQRKKERGGADG
jgi:ketosteroid isomerase-like protein